MVGGLAEYLNRARATTIALDATYLANVSVLMEDRKMLRYILPLTGK